MKTQLNRKKRKEIKLLVKQGYKHLKAQEFGIAFHYFNQACTIANHQDGEVFTDLGYCSHEMGDDAGAVEYYTTALRLIKNRNKHAHIHFMLGTSHHELGETAKAIESFENGFKIEPHHAPAYISLSALHQELGNTEEMEKMARQALELDPSIPCAHNSLGISFLIRERAAEAKDCFAAAIKLDRREIISRYYYAVACAFLEQWEQALKAANYVLKVYPGHTPAQKLKRQVEQQVTRIAHLN